MRYEKAWIFLVLLFMNLTNGSNENENETQLSKINSSLLENNKMNQNGPTNILATTTKKDNEEVKIELSPELTDMLTYLFTEAIRPLNQIQRINLKKNGKLQDYFCTICIGHMLHVLKDDRDTGNEPQICARCAMEKWPQKYLKQLTLGRTRVSEFANPDLLKDYNFLYYLGAQITNLVLSIFMVVVRGQSTWENVSGGEGEVPQRIIHFMEMLLRLSIGAYSLNIIVLLIAEYLNGINVPKYFRLPGAKAAFQVFASIFFGITYWYYRDTADSTPLFVAYNVLKQIAIWLNGNFFFAVDSEIFYRTYSFFPQYYLKKLDPKYVKNALSYGQGINHVALLHMGFTIVWGTNLALGAQLFIDWLMGYDIGMTGVDAPAFCIGNLLIWAAVSFCELYKSATKGASYPMFSVSMVSIIGFIWYFSTLTMLSLTEKSATCLTSLAIGFVGLVFRHYFSDGMDYWFKWLFREPSAESLFPNFDGTNEMEKKSLGETIEENTGKSHDENKLKLKFIDKED